MKYFLTFDQLDDDPCYHEFFRGSFDSFDCMKEDSLYVHDNDETAKIIYQLIREAIGVCDPYDVTYISKTKWENIYKLALSKDEKVVSIFKELNTWVEDVFKENNVFTLIGL